MAKHSKKSDERAPYRTGVPTPKVRPRRQEGEPKHPRGGPHSSTRGGAHKSNREERETIDRGETPPRTPRER